LTGNTLIAQCNNNIDPSTDCGFLFLLDGTIIDDGFCSTLPQSNPVSELTPFCLNLSSSENTGFFLIEPITPSLFLSITPTNCSEVEVPGQGWSSGMQAVIFKDCTFDNVLACSPLCNSEKFVIGGTDFVPFQQYLLAFDGCNGSVCDFEIEIQSGAISEIIPLVDPQLYSPIDVCSNESNRILVQGLPALTEGNWTLDGVPSFQTLFNGKAVQINDWGMTGTKEICAKINDPQSGEVYFDSCWIVNVQSAPAIVSSTQDSVLCQDDQLSLFVDGLNIENVNWSGPGLSCNFCSNPTLTMPDSNIVIWVTASNSSECEDQIELPFLLVNDPLCLVGVNESLEEFALDILPNPFTDYFSFFLAKRSKVQIYNLSGEVVFDGENIEGDQRLRTDTWIPGIYFISVQTESSFGVKRILKIQ